MSYGGKLDPDRQALKKGHKGDRQYVIVPNIPTTTAGPGQLVIVNAPDQLHQAECSSRSI